MTSINPKPFRMITDFATVKNDRSYDGQATIPSSAFIPGNSYGEWHQDVTIAEAHATVKGRMKTNKNADRWMVANAMSFDRLGVVIGFPAVYSVDMFIWRVNPTTVRCQLLIQNPYSDNLTGVSGAEVVDFFFNTFVAPFST